MFVVKLSGGLGNQMFQFVFGQHLAKRYNVEVKYEASYFEKPKAVKNVTHWGYELEKFELDIPIVENDFFNKLQVLNRTNKIKYLIYKTIFDIKNSYLIITESSFEFFSYLPMFFKNRYFIGYWQNEDFFYGLENSIPKWFVLKDKIQLKKQNIDTLIKIQNSNSVSLAVRRGDHVKLNASSDLSYYLRAIDIISHKVDDPFFFIFSDDISWCKKNLLIEQKHFFVNSSNNLPFEDMELMSLCKHNIISNSTFNWWGAYLNTHIDKIIVSPKNKRPINCKNFIQL
jgi:hypothetical protein